MRIVYFGTPALAVPTLAAVAAQHEVVAAVTQPDRPRGRSGKPEPPEVKVWAAAHGIAVHQPEKLHDGQFEQWLRDQAPEACVMAAYGRLLKQPVLDVPPLGWLNVHPSLLPRWRGPSPIQTALLEGDDTTGVTIMRVVLEMDAGNIVLQQNTPILPEETAGELTERLAELGAPLMLEALTLLADGRIQERQQDPAHATISRLFEKEHGRIRWTDPAERIHNLVRACNPWPMAHCLFRGQMIRILKTTVLPLAGAAAPGTVIDVTRDWASVATGEGALALLRVQMAGKKPQDMEVFLRGTPLQAGERFEDIP